MVGGYLQHFKDFFVLRDMSRRVLSCCWLGPATAFDNIWDGDPKTNGVAIGGAGDQRGLGYTVKFR